MKVTCDREAFGNAFATAAGACPAKTPRPILESVLLRCHDGVAALVGTDMEISAVCTIAGATIEEDGETLLLADKMRSILSASTDSVLTIESADQMVGIVGAMSDYEFPTDDPAKFPQPGEFDADHFHSVAARDLKRLIKRTAFAVSEAPGQFAHGGILVDRTSSSMSFTSTNGSRLARQTVAAEQTGVPAWTDQVVMQLKAARLLDRHMEETDGPVHLAFSETDIAVRTGSAVIWSRQVEGRFRRFNEAALDPPKHRIALAVDRFRAAVQQASVATDEITRAVDFRFGDGQLMVTAVASRGRARSKCSVEFDGEASIRIDPTKLLDALKAMGDIESVAVDFVSPLSPLVFRTNDGMLFVLSPMEVRES